MNTQTPNKYGRAGETGHSDESNKGPKVKPTANDKKNAFDQGLTNNSNTQTGTAQSGYDEKNPKQPGGDQQQQPKVTNEDNKITNSQEQNLEGEEPVDEQSAGNSRKRSDPEIDAPIPEGEDTEDKIPKMKA